MSSIRDIIGALTEGATGNVGLALAALEQLNELLLRSTGGSGSAALRISSIVPLLVKLLLSDVHSDAGSEVRLPSGDVIFFAPPCPRALRRASCAGCTASVLIIHGAADVIPCVCVRLLRAWCACGCRPTW
jgi:hypothetical protein